MKIKNKKLFALLMLPAVIAMMVLPLCSFTTTTDPEYVSYEPIIRKDVGYVYQTSSNTYYGSISNYNKVLAPRGDLTNKTIKTNASSYLIITSPSMRINYSAFGSGSSIDYVNGEEILKLQMGCSGGNDTNNLYFNGVVDYYGFISLDTALNDYIDFTTSYSTKYFRYVGYCDYLVYDSSGNMSVGYHEFDYRADADDGILPLTHLVERIYMDIPGLDDGRLYINHIHCQYYNLSNYDANWYPIESEVFTISNPIYTSEVREAMTMDFIDEILGRHIYNDVYDEIYKKAFDAGVSSVTSWSSIGDFLTDVVGSFFSFEFWDGFSLGGVMAIIVGALLFVAFLKVFAGG